MRRTGRSRMVAAVAVAAGLVLTGCARGAGSAEDPPRGDPPRKDPDVAAPADGSGPAVARGERTRCVGGAIVDHAFDVTDDRRLVGFANNVFAGRVAEKVGSEGSTESTTAAMASAQFSVEVLENVKGNLQGIVTVSQEGGYDPAAGCVMLMQDDPLLKPGEEVLFVTRYDERHRRHQITSSGYGDVRIRDRAHREANLAIAAATHSRHADGRKLRQIARTELAISPPSVRILTQ